MFDEFLRRFAPGMTEADRAGMDKYVEEFCRGPLKGGDAGTTRGPVVVGERAGSRLEYVRDALAREFDRIDRLPHLIWPAIRLPDREPLPSIDAAQLLLGDLIPHGDFATALRRRVSFFGWSVGQSRKDAEQVLHATASAARAGDSVAAHVDRVLLAQVCDHCGHPLGLAHVCPDPKFWKRKGK